MGKERLLRRRAEMHALTRPHGVHGAFGAAAAANGAPAAPPVPSAVVAGPVPQPAIDVTGLLGPETAGVMAAAPPPPPSLPGLEALPPAPPVRILRRQDSWPLGDARRNTAGGEKGGDEDCAVGDVAGVVAATAVATAEVGAGAGEGMTGAAVAPVGAEVAANGTTAAGRDSAKEASDAAAATATAALAAAGAAAASAAAASAAATAAAAADYAGNWEAVEWAESCLVSVSAVPMEGLRSLRSSQLLTSTDVNMGTVSFSYRSAKYCRSGQDVFEISRSGSGGFQNLTGQVGSLWPDPTREKRVDP